MTIQIFAVMTGTNVDNDISSILISKLKGSCFAVLFLDLLFSVLVYHTGGGAKMLFYNTSTLLFLPLKTMQTGKVEPKTFY